MKLRKFRTALSIVAEKDYRCNRQITFFISRYTGRNDEASQELFWTFFQSLCATLLPSAGQFRSMKGMLSRIPRIYWAVAIFAAVVSLYIFSNIQRNKDGKGSVRERAFLRPTQFKDREGNPIPMSRFAGAETLRSTQSKALIAEINNVIEQNGLPADVFDGLSVDVPGKEIGKKQTIAEKKKKQEEYNERQKEQQDSNIAVTLDREFHPFYLSTPNDLEKLWEASPDPEDGPWGVDEQKLESVKTILAHFEPKRQTIRNKLNEEGTQFYYVFVRPESLGTNAVKNGFQRLTSSGTPDIRTRINTEASRYLSDYALLEEYAAAHALLAGDIWEALEALEHIFRIACLASTLSSVGVRADVAVVRLRAFDVMQRIVRDPKLERRHLLALREMLMEERKNWTPESVAWFGDRASGIMLYNNLSTYGLDDVLEPAELGWLEKRGKLEEQGKTNDFLKGYKKYHEEDKIFYLQSMQTILDFCNAPFTKRQNVLNQIKKELHAQEDTYDKKGVTTEPFIANIMLKDAVHLMRLFAKDQSALDRTIAVILRSLGQRNTDSYRDPFTDKPYDVKTVNGMLQVSATELPPFAVPIFTETE